MPLDPELVKILACPRCKGPLSFREEQARIDCLACRLSYPIEDGIPVMLVEEAQPLPAAPPQGGE